MRLCNTLTLEEVKAADRLEARYYGEEHIAGWEKSWSWQQSFPWMSCFMEEGGEILAMLDLFPVHWSYYQELLSGKTDTDHLEEKDIVDLKCAPPGEYPMLLMTVIVAEEARNKGCLSAMFNDRTEWYRTCEDKGYSFPSIATENFTLEGRLFSEKRGFRKVLENEEGGVVYEMSWQEFVSHWNGRIKLLSK